MKEDKKSLKEIVDDFENIMNEHLLNFSAFYAHGEKFFVQLKKPDECPFWYKYRETFSIHGRKSLKEYEGFSQDVIRELIKRYENKILEIEKDPKPDEIFYEFQYLRSNIAKALLHREIEEYELESKTFLKLAEQNIFNYYESWKHAFLKSAEKTKEK